MQTFLPESGFAASARALDDKRLFNQINEAQIIYRTLTGYYERKGKKGWPHHPATRMWSGYEPALNAYRNACIRECWRRGITTNAEPVDAHLRAPKMPCWWGDRRLHESHRSQLIGKKPEFYKRKWPNVAEGLVYFWPTNCDLYKEEFKKNNERTNKEENARESKSVERQVIGV